MFDPVNSRAYPKRTPLEGLNRDKLPDQLAEFYARIVTWRLRLRAVRLSMTTILRC